MSVQSEIDRINGEVNSQSAIIDEITAILDSKAGSNPKLQEKTVMPTAVQQEVVPDTEYDGLSKVTVEAVSKIVHITQIKISALSTVSTFVMDPGKAEITIYVNNQDVFHNDYVGVSDGDTFSVDFTIDLSKDYLGFYLYATSYDSLGYFIDGNTMYIKCWSRY